MNKIAMKFWFFFSVLSRVLSPVAHFWFVIVIVFEGYIFIISTMSVSQGYLNDSRHMFSRWIPSGRKAIALYGKRSTRAFYCLKAVHPFVYSASIPFNKCVNYSGNFLQLGSRLLFCHFRAILAANVGEDNSRSFWVTRNVMLKRQKVFKCVKGNNKPYPNYLPAMVLKPPMASCSSGCWSREALTSWVGRVDLLMINTRDWRGRRSFFSYGSALL